MFGSQEEKSDIYYNDYEEDELEQEELAAPDFNFKVIVVGNKRVGKTSITNRCVFNEFNEASKSTRVVQVVPKIFNIPGTLKTAQLHIWDTLGQEKFMSLAPLFFRRSIGALLVYDVSSLESFEAIDKWYQQILQHTDSRIIIMMIGNKKDKDTREVPFNMALGYALKNNFGLMEVSARQGLGISEAFNLLVQQIYKSILVDSGEDLDEVGNIRRGTEPDTNVLRNSIMLRTQASSGSVVINAKNHRSDDNFLRKSGKSLRSSQPSGIK